MQAQMERMQKDMTALMPKEMPGVMATPAAAMAAGSAIGLAMAGHAFGLWAGFLSGSVAASQRALGYEFGGGDIDRFREFESPRARARTTAQTLIADAERTSVQSRPRGGRPAKAASSGRAKRAESVEATDALVLPSGKRSAKPDDLKAISGIGPKLEKVLNDLGISTYAQIAALTDEQVIWLDGRLGVSGRIDRDGWIEQAENLAGGK